MQLLISFYALKNSFKYAEPSLWLNIKGISISSVILWINCYLEATQIITFHLKYSKYYTISFNSICICKCGWIFMDMAHACLDTGLKYDSEFKINSKIKLKFLCDI